MVWTAGIYAIAKYMTWSLILWDHLITLDDEVRPYCFSHVGLSTEQLEDHFVLVSRRQTTI
ncbi:hypothetical protein ARMGADRAFT_1085812 [Armillaria gallica]|uniref:Uncharacterized protein n=1 Tax=Armillaria gallica TaxID=47427 RepID=A0A2H3CZZ8_ARMGA|nr:hypothetical protein ARMGADRAFT_1085812 [Armillaria gallica]